MPTWSARQHGRIRVVQEAVTAALKRVVTEEKDRSALAGRLKRGRVVYQSDPTGSGFTERIEPDGTHARSTHESPLCARAVSRFARARINALGAKEIQQFSRRRFA